MPLFSQSSGGGAETLVFLHGFGGTHRVWRDIVPALSRYASVILYDLPGHGGSLDYPDAGPAKTAALAILADLEARGIASAHIVGHSMGGAIAGLIGILQPERVASLTLLSPGGFGPDINHRLLTRYAAATDLQTMLPCLEAMYGWYSPVSEASLEDVLASRAVAGQTEALERMAVGMVRDGRQGQLPLDRLDSLNAPISVLWGGLDNVLPARQAVDLPPQFSVQVLPDIGHMLPQEVPDVVIELIRKTARL